MTASNFAPSLNLTLVYEGGWSNNPKDPGRATYKGVTQAVYDDDRDQRGLPRQSVRLMTDYEMGKIYRWRYWDMVRGDALPPGADYATFDFSVNSGVARAARILQGIVGVDADGVIGPYTVDAAVRYVSKYGAPSLSDELCKQRMTFLRGLPTFADFGAGWTRRVMGATDGHQIDDTGVIDRSFAMAMGNLVKPPANPIATAKTYSATQLAA